MSRVKALLAFTLLASSAIVPAAAQSLQLSPVTIELPAGALSGVFTLSTESKDGVAVQARVFRWSQAGGEDKLEKTEDVAVSPPVLKVQPGAPSKVRLVRVAKAPVSGEETYRVLFDEIPDRSKLQSGTVALVVRQSVPVFFAGVDLRPGSVAWKVIEHNRKLALQATNGGQKRVHIKTLAVSDDKNRDLLKSGMGYVLNGQSKRWDLKVDATGAKTLIIKAESDTGPINASVSVGKGG